MKFLRLFSSLILISTSLIETQIVASPSTLETPNFGTIVGRINEIQEACHDKKLLVVFDLDNVLLKTEGLLGSEQWSNWQSKLISDSKDKANFNAKNLLVANDFPGFLAINNLVLSLSAQVPVEKEQPNLISQLQNQGAALMILTSRGPVDVVYTLRELKRNGYDFSKTAPQTDSVLPYSFSPLDPKNPEAQGFTPTEIEDLKLQHPKEISYTSGILFTEGQHKGAILKILLSKVSKSFCGPVYIDNQTKYIERVLKYFPDATTFRYSHEDSQMNEFLRGFGPNVTKAIDDWKQFSAFMRSQFPTQFHRIFEVSGR
jgi:hypothetical protein